MTAREVDAAYARWWSRIEALPPRRIGEPVSVTIQRSNEVTQALVELQEVMFEWFEQRRSLRQVGSCDRSGEAVYGDGQRVDLSGQEPHRAAQRVGVIHSRLPSSGEADHLTGAP